ncbi:hypothetical protein [Burkholderia ubonensis]|uniref:hypothetical protein n=1 Tax=Burkholderia ubonensis TaxID=101571 RepID=UPI000754239C|nr:hypothetical protein [Burkholderia ubonensis]KWN75780.1 hypothetical protein WM23_01910 [Burkholderia ubonensis]
MATSDFLPFGGGGAANVIDQPTYAALAARLSGFQSGTAQSAQLNKVWRQSSIMAAVLAQFIADLTGQNAIDDGTTATLLANLKAAVSAQSIDVAGAARKLRATCAANATSITFTADQLVVATGLGGLSYMLPSFNKTLNLGTIGAGGMDTGTATAGGWLAVYAAYAPSLPLSATNPMAYGTMEGATAASTTYSGSAGLPSAYTASALLAVLPMSSTVGQLKACLVNGRRVTVPSLLTFQTSTTSSMPVSFSLSGAVPKAAVRASGIIVVASTSASNVGMAIQSDSTTNALGVQNVSQSGGTSGTGTWSIDLATAQTLYYTATNSAGTPTFSLYVSGYEV